MGKLGEKVRQCCSLCLPSDHISKAYLTSSCAAGKWEELEVGPSWSTMHAFEGCFRNKVPSSLSPFASQPLDNLAKEQMELPKTGLLSLV